jgi:hypothetical protein
MRNATVNALVKGLAGQGSKRCTARMKHRKDDSATRIHGLGKELMVKNPCKVFGEKPDGAIELDLWMVGNAI